MTAIHGGGDNMTTTTDKETNSLVAIVFSGDRTPPKAGAIVKTLQARLPDFVLPLAAESKNEQALLAIYRGVMCGVMRFGLPAPLSGLDRPFTTAWYWPKAWDTLRAHKSHIVVSATGGDDPRLRAVILGQLLAAVVEATPAALGIHWASSNAVWPTNVVAGMAPAGSQTPPMLLCISTALSRDTSLSQGSTGPRLSGFTQGLEAFGLMEVECLGYSGSPQSLNATLLDLAGYLIASGPVIKVGTRLVLTTASNGQFGMKFRASRPIG